MIFQITLLTNTLFIFPFLTIASFIYSVLDQNQSPCMLCSFHNTHTKKELVSEYIFKIRMHFLSKPVLSEALSPQVAH